MKKKIAADRITRNTVCLIYQDEYPWDVRIEKFADALVKQDIGVHLVSRNRTGRSDREIINEKFTVHRLPKGIGQFDRNIINFPAFFSPFWILKVLWTVRQFCCTVIIVRDLPMTPCALVVGKLLSIPVIMDMAENYPALVASKWRYQGVGAFDVLIRNPRLLRILERIVIRRVSGLIVVSKASLLSVQERCKHNVERVAIVGNTPELAETELPKVSVNQVVQPMTNNGMLRIGYVGWVEKHRGIDVAINALARLIKSGHKCELVIMGTGRALDECRSLAVSAGVSRSVEFVGWIDHDELSEYLETIDIGIVPHRVTPHTNTTLPNKIFDYMSMKLPVLVSNCESLKEIIEEAKCGIVYDGNDPADLAKSIEMLFEPIFRKKLGENGYKAILQKYNWKVDKKRLTDFVQEFLPD